jgi:ethanolamine ammonia-lyase large subunit
VTRFRSTIGLPGRISTRNQPNHPTDDSRGIALSALDGLLHGAGDAVIGVNPATDTLEDYIRICEVLEAIRTNSTSPRSIAASAMSPRPSPPSRRARPSIWCSSPSPARPRPMTASA